MRGKKSIIALAVLSAPAALVGLNLHTFHRLTDEAPIARLHFVEMSANHYAVELLTGDFCASRHYEIRGDEWRLDARYLKWKPLANLVGLDAMYRLDRLSGRYSDAEQARQSPPEAHDISDKPLLDLSDHLTGDWLGWSPVDTSFGSSVYEKIDPAYEYTVYRTQSALVVRKEKMVPAHFRDGALVISIKASCEGS